MPQNSVAALVKIDTYTAQRSLQPGSTPGTKYSSAVAEELAGVGRAVESAADIFIQRQEQRENFSTENNYRKLKLELAEDLRRDTEAAPPDGADLHANFLQNTFRPKRDAFLSTVPDRLRPQFEAVLNDETGADAYQWSTAAATSERDLNYGWQRSSILETQNQLATAIAMDPDGYDALLADGEALIEASSLPTAEREKLKTDWGHMAQVALVNRLLETDPQGVLRELGVDARQLSPTTQFELLSREVQWQESRDNPSAVSPKGALGLMQVMPDTAREIAGKLGDTRFPTDKEAIAEYMSNPYVNKTYGEFYLREQLQTFANTRNPIETALVAYNAGPGVAKKWVESGYDDRMLPKETRDYKDAITARISAPGAKGDPSSVKFEGADLKDTSSDLRSRVADAFSSIGLDKVRVNSGSRTPEENKAAGGADESQHLENNAMDIDVSGMPNAERLELIKALSAAGVTGLGIGANIIHADLGGRRAWGYKTSAGGGEVPKWAAGVIAEHLNGTTPPIRRVAGRFGNMPYDTRQQFTTKADQLIAAQAAAAKPNPAQQTEIRKARDSQLALIRATGQGDPAFDETAVSTILGEAEYLKFARDRDVAQQSYTATQGVNEMTEEQLEQRIADYDPLLRSGSLDFAERQEVQAAVEKEVQRVRRLRSTRPDEAAGEFPEVKGAYEAMVEEGPNGELEARDPAKVQNFVRAMLDAQSRIGIPPNAQAPIDRGWARRIAQTLLTFPLTEDKDRNPSTNPTRVNVMAKLADVYDGMQLLFGDYTDEVLLYAVAEYGGVDKAVAKTLTGALSQVALGRDPFTAARKLADAAETAADITQSEGSRWQPGGIFRDGPSFGILPDPFATTSAPAQASDLPGDIDGDGMLSPEEQLRLSESGSE